MNKTIIGTIATVAGTAVLGTVGTLLYRNNKKEDQEPKKNEVAATAETEVTEKENK